MRFLIVGDLHGQMPKLYRRRFDAIIAPGDFCSDDAKRYMFQALQEHLNDPATARRWHEICGKTEAKRLLRKSLDDGRSILKQLDSYGVPVFIVPGNWDWTGDDRDPDIFGKDYWPKLKRGLKNVIDIYHRRVDAGELALIGVGIHSGPEYPQTAAERKRYSAAQLKRKKKGYDKEYRHLSRLFERTKKPVVFLSHNVPYNTPLDQIVNPQSPRNGQHFGSVLARELILKHKPVVCIGGHMHEHFTSCTLGKTLCINAGFGGNVNVLLDLEGGRVREIEFIRSGRLL